MGRPCGLDVRDGCRERNAGFAFQNVERGRAEFALAAHDVAAPKMPPDGGVRVFLQKLRRNILENREPQEILCRYGRSVRPPRHVF